MSTLHSLIEQQVGDHLAVIQEASETASKEHSLEKALDRMLGAPEAHRRAHAHTPHARRMHARAPARARARACAHTTYMHIHIHIHMHV